MITGTFYTRKKTLVHCCCKKRRNKNATIFYINQPQSHRKIDIHTSSKLTKLNQKPSWMEKSKEIQPRQIDILNRVCTLLLAPNTQTKLSTVLGVVTTCLYVCVHAPYLSTGQYTLSNCLCVFKLGGSLAHLRDPFPQQGKQVYLRLVSVLALKSQH